MDYKKFEENIYKYILEYNKGREKAIKKVEKVQKILNLTNEEISQIIICLLYTSPSPRD